MNPVLLRAFAIFLGCLLACSAAADPLADLKEKNNVRQIAIACLLYATEHQQELPKTLESLLPKYIAGQAVLVSPLAPAGATDSYKLELAGTKLGSLSKPSEAILIRCKYSAVLGYADGHVALSP